MTPFGLPPCFRLEVIVEAPLPLDGESGGPVRMVRITGGTVSGEINGTILPGGTDWQEVQADGSISIEARYLLELDDGSRIELQSRGLRAPDAGGFWSSMWLRTPASQHAWLNRAQFLALGRKVEGHVALEVYALPAPSA